MVPIFARQPSTADIRRPKMVEGPTGKEKADASHQREDNSRRYNPVGSPTILFWLDNGISHNGWIDPRPMDEKTLPLRERR
jgi:hypothetical protein